MEIPKSLKIFCLVFAIALTGCHFPTPETQIVEGDSIEQPNLKEEGEVEIYVFTPTSVVSLQEERQETEQEEVESQETQQEEPEVQLERITRSLVDVLIDSPTVTTWYQQYWRKLEIITLRCQECFADEIEELLGPVFTNENWRGVKIGRVMYVHSGWGHDYGPELGEIFRRVIRENASDPFVLCLDTECYESVDYVVLDGEKLEQALVLSQVFEKAQDTDRFILTCDGFVDENVLTPKLIVQLKLINP